MKCKNCSTEFEGNYCPNCGQRSAVEPLTLPSLLSSLFYNLFYFEQHFIFTFKSLWINPKGLLDDYTSGQRKRYSNPFQFFLFFLTIYLLAYSFFGDQIFQALGDKLNYDGSRPDGSEGVFSLKDRMEKYMNYLYFFQPLFFSLTIKLMFWRKMNVAQSLVLAFFVEGLNLLLATIMMLPTAFWDLYAYRTIGGILIYGVVFSRFGKNYFVGALQGIIAGLLSVALFSALIGGIFTLYIQTR